MTESTEMPTPSEIREELLDLVHRELVGPFNGEDEKIEGNSEVGTYTYGAERPRDRYLVGMLAPRETFLGQENDESGSTSDGATETDGCNAASENASTRATQLIPSSFGFTFTVDADVDDIEIEAKWGRYDYVTEDEEGESLTADERYWQRKACGGKKTIALVKGEIEQTSIDSEDTFVHIRGHVRNVGDQKSVTLFLINDDVAPASGRDADVHWIFQTELSVQGKDNRHIFVARPTTVHGGGNDDLAREDRELEMIYRDECEFAVGHGVAVDWAEPSSEAVDRTNRIFTCVSPRYEVRKQTPPSSSEVGFEGLAGLELRMDVLGESEPSEVIEKLQPLVDSYTTWIEREKNRIDDPESRLQGHQASALETIVRCEKARDRIAEGIEMLKNDEQAMDAFQFANRSMHLQRIRSIYVRQLRQRQGVVVLTDDALPEITLGSVDAEAKNKSWYPFQLAFVLLNIASTTKLDHPDRCDPTQAIADLLWFPTGGGKTEAYLGLAAYAIALRRLQGEVAGRRGSAGVTVLMRYTLRLLTLQQFQRATTLICAMETQRRDSLEEGDTRWGNQDEEFTIGLWIGAKSTPNWTKDSATVIRELNDRSTSSKGSPHQLPYCPWCSKDIKPHNLKAKTFASGDARTHVFCSNPECDFSSRNSDAIGLPVLVVDEEIYRRLPTLLIATVDKFAQLPWSGLTSMLFGQVDSYCPRHGFISPDTEDKASHRKIGNTYPATSTVQHGVLRPPDLIIQDELHLISGPLGSMVGLYETAVDELCTWELEDGTRVRPKVVASTATIRNASKQVSRLFSRQVNVFPPSGLDAKDNFFSRRRETNEIHGRMYMAICAPGKSFKAAQIRVYTAYLSASQFLYKKYGGLADPWMTLVGYYNSMRELGGMRRLVDGDVSTRLQKMDRHGLATRWVGFDGVKELTSRMGSAQIPKTLDELERDFSPEKDELRRLRKTDPTIRPIPNPIDVLLATSMISVGVDIDRLGLMVVGGQPKGTSEYIQASSRVGRQHPGVVCTIYNWNRPRDLSHYERFRDYHSKFYAHVEALSITPFASRAIDKGLAGLLIGLVRAKCSEANSMLDAGKVPTNRSLADESIDIIVRRIENAVGLERADEVRHQLVSLIDAWIRENDKAANLVYRRPPTRDGSGNETPLLQDPEDKSRFACMNSLREVEPTSALFLYEGVVNDED